MGIRCQRSARHASTLIRAFYLIFDVERSISIIKLLPNSLQFPRLYYILLLYSQGCPPLIGKKGSWIRHGVTQKECETEALLSFIAGSETTATSVILTLLYIISTPLIYQKLKEEINTAIREGRASSPITNAEARELPYLQVCSDHS